MGLERLPKPFVVKTGTEEFHPIVSRGNKPPFERGHRCNITALQRPPVRHLGPHPSEVIDGALLTRSRQHAPCSAHTSFTRRASASRTGLKRGHHIGNQRHRRFAHPHELIGGEKMIHRVIERVGWPIEEQITTQ